MAEKEAVVTDASEEDSQDALEFLKTDQEALKEDAGEGDETPSPDDAGKDAQGEEAADEPGEEEEIPSEKESTRERFQELTDKLRKYEKYDAIIEMFEEQPELRAKVVEKRLGLGGDAEARVPAAPAGPTEEQKTAIKAQLEKAMQEDPVGTLVYLIREQVKAEGAPTATLGVKSLIREYKSDRRNSDDGELFKKYEKVFDEFVRQADMAQIMADPDKALLAIETFAFGTWATDQRKKISAAKKGKQPAVREIPRSLERPGSKPTAVAKAKRALTEEERDLANRYGEDLVEPDEEEREDTWGRL